MLRSVFTFLTHARDAAWNDKQIEIASRTQAVILLWELALKDDGGVFDDGEPPDGREWEKIA